MSWELPRAERVGNLDLSQLGLDEAYLNITSDYGDPLYIYTLYEECFDCPFKLAGKYPATSSLKLKTHHPWKIRLLSSEKAFVAQNDDTDTLCEVEHAFGQYGVYGLRQSADGNTCTMETKLEPVDSEISILYCALILFLIGLIYRIVVFLHSRNYLDNLIAKIRYLFGFEDDPEEPNKRPRIKSLDTFRGITIALMIFVNDGAGGYWFFEHAPWNGLGVADLVFPWFMWIMGVCIPMGIRSAKKRKTKLWIQLRGITRRSIVLWLLGFMWNTSGWINLAVLRVPGVLQRFGISYFIVASTAAIFAKEDSQDDAPKPSSWRKFILDILETWPRWIVASSFLIVHCILTFCLPVPDCPTGYLGPGGLNLYDWNPDVNVTRKCVGGAAGYIDVQFFTSKHIYSNPTPKKIFDTAEFDPEGILGSFLTIFQVFLGYQAGQIIQSYRGHNQRMIRFVSWGTVCGIIGAILCKGSQNDGWIPINKNLWSLSYVFVTTCFAFYLLTICYFLLDVKGWWRGEPFIYAGMNSIVLYLGHYTAWQMGPFNYISGDMRTHWDNLVESIWGVCCWLFVAFVMFKKKIFITV